MPDDMATNVSPATRAANAALMMSAALRLGVGLPSGVEQQSAEALDAVASSLRQGDGHAPASTIDALVTTVPAPARGIMRLALAGADVRRLLTVLDQIVASDRWNRWETRLALAYPTGVCLAAFVGIALVALVNEPSLNALAESTVLPQVPSAPVPHPVWEAVSVPAATSAVGVLLGVLVWWSRSGIRAKAARQRAAVACEVEAIFTEVELDHPRRKKILADLAAGEGSALAGPLQPPLALAVAAFPLAERSAALREVATLYRHTAEADRTARRALLPAGASVVAGLAVLLFGIALFLPLVQFFSRIAAMPAAPPWSPGL
jgi:hypothetical protein